MSKTSTARGFIAAIAIVPCVVVLSPVFLVAVFLLLFVSAVRAIGRRLEPAFVTWPELVEFDRTLGWKPRPNMDGHYLADQDDVFRIVTDREGWPGRRSLDESDIVVIGDSFAFGYGVDTNRSFAELDPKLRVKALGAPGYSMVQPVLLMEQLGRRLRGRLVVWFAYLENDLQDNLAPEMRKYRAPFVRLDPVRGEWTIVDEHLEPRKWECSNLDARRLFPRFCVPGPLADRAYSACDYLIGRAERACHEAGAHLVMVTIPHPMQLTTTGMASLAALSGHAGRVRCRPSGPSNRRVLPPAWRSADRRQAPSVPRRLQVSRRHSLESPGPSSYGHAAWAGVRIVPVRPPRRAHSSHPRGRGVSGRAASVQRPAPTLGVGQSMKPPAQVRTLRTIFAGARSTRCCRPFTRSTRRSR